MSLNSLYTGAGVFSDKVDNKIEAAYQAVHNQFLASAKAVKLAHQIMPNAMIGCMINQIESYAKTTKPLDQLQEHKANQLNMFYPDVQVRGYYPTYILNYLKKHNINVEITEEDNKILRE